MLELLLAFAGGIIIGVIFGLIPGLHPNLLVIFAPLLSFGGSLTVAVFLVALGVSNIITDFIPSILIGAPEEGTELAVMPGHKMLLRGHGYAAIKLSVIGALGACIFISLLMPAIFTFIPLFFRLIVEYTHVLLIFILAVVLLTEKYKYRALLVAALAGSIGIIANRLPISNELLLFPILSGMFGVSYLLLQKASTLPKQTFFEPYVGEKKSAEAVIKGSIGGIVSGFLPGVGSSQIAALFASADKKEESYLMSIGAITMANLFLSLLSIYLISRPRSGIAVALTNTIGINFTITVAIILTVLAAAGITAIITLFIAKRFINKMSEINYSALNKMVIIAIIVLVFVFTQYVGLLLFAVCTCLGVYTNLAGIKRSTMMAVLIVPTILFYMGI